MRSLGVEGAVVERHTHRITPTSLPVDEAVKPSTQPVQARAKKRGGGGGGGGGGASDFARVE